MNIQKRGKGYYISVSNGFDQNGKRIKVTCTYVPDRLTATGKERSEAAIMKDVEEYAREFEKKVKNGETVVSKDYLLGDFVTAVWEPEWADTHLSIRTKETYLGILKNIFFVKLAKKKLSGISTMDIQMIINTEFKSGKTAETMKRYVGAINSVFRFAYKMGFVVNNPCARLDIPVEKKKKEVVCFDSRQSLIFLNALETDYIDHYSGHSRVHNGKNYSVPEYDEVHTLSTMWKTFFVLALASGMRRGELCALKWEDIDFENKKISINRAVTLTDDGPFIKIPKTISSIRVVTVPDKCIEYLRKWYEEEKEYYEAHKAHWPYDDVKSFENCFIFIQKGGKIMHPTTPSSKFREILERHNARCDEDEKLPLVKFHALRHSCASLLIEKGVDILTVSKRLGHSKITTTLDIYTHNLKKDDREAADVMGSIIEQDPSKKKNDEEDEQECDFEKKK